MAGIVKPPGAFAITPHKVSVCILLQIYVPSSQMSVPFPFSSVAQHNRLGLFLLALTKSCDDIFEPKLDELICQLREVCGSSNLWFIDHLTSRLSALSLADDLFNFFTDVRGILGGSEAGVLEDDQFILEPSSNLGMFLRRCILAFNLLSFEGVCHLLRNTETYYKEALSSCPSYEATCVEDSSINSEAFLEYENMDLENFVFEKVTEEIEARKWASERVPFHLHAPKALFGLVEDIEVAADPRSKHSDKGREASPYMHPPKDASRDFEPNSGIFLRTNWQIQGYLQEQADAIEKSGSSFSLNAFELILRRLHKLAPELHRVHFLRYLNNLYHDDYLAALENLHRYFDYSAGTEGIDFVSTASSWNDFGRYEIALLFLGVMHFQFGHPKQALEVLTEAVRVSQQQSNDTSLAYTLAAICNLLSEVGVSSTAGILGSSISPLTCIGISLSTQQQLFVLLRGSLKRAESLNLRRLVASNHLAKAKFDLMEIKRPEITKKHGPKSGLSQVIKPSGALRILEKGENSGTRSCPFSPLKLVSPAISLRENTVVVDSGNCRLSPAMDELQLRVFMFHFMGYFLRIAWETSLIFVFVISAPLARINALVYATCFTDALSSSDAALAYVKLIQHLAVFRGYNVAFAALKIAEEKFLSLSRSRILLLKLQLLHEHTLHRGHLKLAQKVCLSVLIQCYLQAAAVAHSLFCMCYQFNLQVENATVLLLLAEIHKRSGNAVLGLPYALASLSFCQSFNLDLLKASATLTLAELWLSLGSNHAKRALSLVHGAFPMILGHGGLELRARAYIAEAKCYLYDPSFSVPENSEVVLDPLRQASVELQILEYHELAAEAFYLMSIVYHKLGQLEEREEAAASFKKHIMALENPQGEEDSLYNML
ncbi:hypothetical protein FH972_024963 [Carpinus fangiana]|uniref:Anaphase-promoting complex subunit 5 n=1 Tax=Carpinus fangiana TaxID=176857 RepID=A0A5N6L008_9ROSI|nr:hypothetical protein FH972_024963 [Carpinus fangiana]